MTKTTVTKSRMRELRFKSVAGVHAVTEWAADTTVRHAKEFCPISDNNAHGHVHMVDTIKAEWRNQHRKDAFVGADYGVYVNFGTIRMPANPFWTTALEQTRKEADVATRLFAKYLR
jgi:HK97 gp10 family phage protein